MGVNDTINMNCQKPSDQKSPTLGVLRMLINNYNPLRAMLVASPANATKSDEFCLTNMLKAAEVRLALDSLRIWSPLTVVLPAEIVRATVHAAVPPAARVRRCRSIHPDARQEPKCVL